MRGPTAEDALLVEQLELWTTEQRHNVPIIPRCFTKDNLRQITSNLGPNQTLHGVGQEHCSSLPSELVCF